MAGKEKKSNVLAANPLLAKIGGQRLVVLLVIIVLFAFFCIKS